VITISEDKQANLPQDPSIKRERSNRLLRIGTIRTRILITFVLLVVIAAVAISMVTVVLGTRDARNRVVDQLESVATLKQSEIQTWVDGLQINLDIVLSGQQVFDQINTLNEEPAGSDAFRDAHDALQTHFNWTAEQMGLFEELFLMDTEGRVILSTRAGQEGEKHNIYDYYKEGLKGHYIQQPSHSLSSGGMIVVVSQPVGDDETLGVLAGRASLESLNEIMIERTGLGDTGETYLVGSNYRLLTKSRFEEYLVPETYVRSDGTDATVENHENGSGRYTSYSGASVFGVYHWLPELQVALIAEQEESEALHATYMALIVIVCVALVAVVIAALASVFLTRSIAAPLADLADTATAIAAGDLERIAKVERRDEVGTVAQAFNTMTHQLRGSVKSLEQRTEQLRTINEVGRSISSILNLDELLPFVANSLRETFKYHNVGIILIDQDSSALVLKASAGTYEGGPDIGTAALESEGIASMVAQQGESLLINDILGDPIYCCIEGLGDTRSELAVPIQIGDRMLGVLDIESDRINAFDELDLFTTQTLADQLAIAIENARLYEHAQELATVEERQRLARDLHDAVTQTLFSASLIAEVLPRLWEKNPEEGKKRLEELRRSTRGALAEMRMLLLELRPAALTEANLSELLKQMTDAAIGKLGIPFNLSVEGQGTLPTDVQITFYRVAQEALNNIQKHASANEVEITLRYQPESVTLIISDNGIGFDPNSVSAEHLGLSIMCERAEAIGTECKVESEIGQGTRITVMWQVLV